MSTEQVPPKRRKGRPAWLEKAAVPCLAVFAFMVRILPLNLARFLARIVGRLVYFILGPQRANVGRNLDIAFGPDLDPHRKQLLAKGFWVHLMQGVVEAFHLANWNSENCLKNLHAEELRQLEALKHTGQGVILVSGHLGSWEIGSYVLALQGYPVHLLHNPGTVAPLFRYLKKQRERSGMNVISRLEHPWILKKLLDKGAWLSMAADLNAGRKGNFVPFFNIQASSYLSPGALQQASKCPIVIITTYREEDGRHRIRIWKTIPYKKCEDRDQGMIEIVNSIHESLEEAIRANPEQWLWTYRRWRTRPKEEQPGPDGLPPRVAPPTNL